MIEAIELQKRFGPVKAVVNVSFAARDGSITGLLGVNGAGKTTTLRIIAGVLRQDAGSVRVGGRSPEDDFPVGKRLGALLDHTGLYAQLTVRENLILAFDTSFRADFRNDVVDSSHAPACGKNVEPR